MTKSIVYLWLTLQGADPLDRHMFIDVDPVTRLPVVYTLQECERQRIMLPTEGQRFRGYEYQGDCLKDVE